MRGRSLDEVTVLGGNMAENSSSKSKSDIVSLDDEHRVAEVLRDSVMGLWEVVNNLTRIRRTRRAEFRVTIFGSARIPKNH